MAARASLAVSGNFTAANQAIIYSCWQQMSVYYAMFDVNVTTIQPNVLTIPTAWDAIGQNISGGYTYVGSFPDSQPASFNEASDASDRVSGIAHEIGHNFGLEHQSTYDLSGNLTAEYSSGSDALHVPIMGLDDEGGDGSSGPGTIDIWDLGHPDYSPSTLQDDRSRIASAIKTWGSFLEGYAGDGYAPNDGYGSTIATATPLTVNGDGSQSISGGVIARLTDQDAFSFTVTTGGQYLMAVTPNAPSSLDPKLSIYNSSGVLIGLKDGNPLTQPLPANNDKDLTLTLAPGTYYAIVGSHGNYSDVGEYDFSVAPYGGTPYPSDSLTAPRGTAVTDLTVSTWSAYPSDRILNWIAGSWETGYEIERSPDGVSNWTVIGTVGQNIPSYTDTTAGSTTYYYRVVTLDSLGAAATSAVAPVPPGSNPPTVATPAAASPSVVTGMTTALSVLGADEGGESSLTYTWTATSNPAARRSHVFRQRQQHGQEHHGHVLARRAATPSRSRSPTAAD